MSQIMEIYNNVAGIPKDGKPRMSYEDFHQAIISIILEKMPKEKLPITNNSGFTLMERVGYNSALAGMRERIEVYYWE